MRILSSVVALLASVSVASAASLPIQGTYGNSESCQLFRQGGLSAVAHSDSLEPDHLIVTATQVIGPEWACEPESVRDANTAFLRCYSQDWKYDLGLHFEEDLEANVLVYSDSDGRQINLLRCD